jgi:Protein of unknown function (DUF3667)
MEYNCIHCSKHVEENFCSHCGQKRYKRIDRKYIWDEIQYTLVHVNKGFLYSIKNIIKNPGRTTREFIDGDRVSHYKPISLAFILATISAFISINVIGLYKMMEAGMINGKVNSNFMEETMSMISKYNPYFMLLFVPVVAVFTRFVFRKWGHNYYEHIIINAIGLSHYLIGCILILYPIMYFLKGNSDLSFKISLYISTFVTPILMIVFFKGFYPDKPLKTIILKILWMVFLLLLLYVLLIILIAITILTLKGMAGGLDYMKGR